jgi:hypothetical protein
VIISVCLSWSLRRVTCCRGIHCDVMTSSATFEQASHSGSRRRKFWMIWAVVCMGECILWSCREINGRRDFSTSRLFFGESSFGVASRPSSFLLSFLEVPSLPPRFHDLRDILSRNSEALCGSGSPPCSLRIPTFPSPSAFVLRKSRNSFAPRILHFFGVSR